MIETTLNKFVAEANRILEEEPNSFTTSIFRSALPYQSIYPEQTEYLFTEFANIFRADAELGGNEVIIKHILEQFPYALALFGDQDEERFEITRFANNLRDNYLAPKLYLVNQETQNSLTDQGLNAVSASQIEDPVTGDVITEILAQNNEGEVYQTTYNNQGVLLNSVLVPRLIDSNQSDQASQPNFAPIPASQDSSTQTTSSSFTQNEDIQQEFDTHIERQAEEIQSDQLDLLYTETVRQAEVEAEAEAEQQVMAEQESIERNRLEYEKAEASRLERLAYQQQQTQQNQENQRQSKAGRRIAIAAGAGATIFSGGLASVIIGGDLIELFS